MIISRRRLVGAASITLALAAVGVAPTSAQAPSVQTLTIALPGGGKAPVVDPSGLRPGPTEVVGTTTAKGEPGFVLVRLRPGTTAEQVRQMTEKKRLSERQIDRLGKVLTHFVVQGLTKRNEAYRATVDLAAGTYIAMDISNERRQPQVAFDIAGDPTGATLPAYDATLDMRDYKFTKTQRTLPAKGTLRVRNAGKQMHFLLAFPTSSSRNASRLEALLRSRSASAERRAERLIAGPPTEPVGLISPGVENRVAVDLRPGNYVLVCFYGSPASRGQHNRRGMTKKVQFK